MLLKDGEGMNIFITGGTSGLGLALASKYHQAGHHVAICGRDLTKLTDEQHKIFSCYQADVLDRTALEYAFKDFEQRLGPLDIVIANAGRSVGVKTKIPNFEATRDVIQINLMGVVNTFEFALKSMLARKQGHLVAISSVAGFVGLPGAAAYSASKAAVTVYCESLGLDLKDQGIKITTICPGFIDTPLTQKNNHSMPFIMNADKAASMIKAAITAEKSLYIFPWPMKFVILFLNKIPRRLYRLLMGLKMFNYSR